MPSAAPRSGFLPAQHLSAIFSPHPACTIVTGRSFCFASRRSLRPSTACRARRGRLHPSRRPAAASAPASKHVVRPGCRPPQLAASQLWMTGGPGGRRVKTDDPPAAAELLSVLVTALLSCAAAVSVATAHDAGGALSAHRASEDGPGGSRWQEKAQRLP